MSRSCPNSEFCGNTYCMENNPHCRALPPRSFGDMLIAAYKANPAEAKAATDRLLKDCAVNPFHAKDSGNG